MYYLILTFYIRETLGLSCCSLSGEFQCLAKSALSQQKEIQITKFRFSQVGGGYIEDEHSRLQPFCLFDFFVLHTLGSLEISNF